MHSEKAYLETFFKNKVLLKNRVLKICNRKKCTMKKELKNSKYFQKILEIFKKKNSAKMHSGKAYLETVFKNKVLLKNRIMILLQLRSIYFLY